MATGDKERDQVEGDTGYKVTDRRLFTAEGDLRPNVEEREQREAEEERRHTQRAPAPEATGDHGFERRPLEEPEGVDFTMLINAMAEPALLFLGEIPHPASGKPQIDLERARIQIDMLDLLRVKTRGNLTPEEEGWFDRILYQLRMLYVSRAQDPKER